jgi:hypothetical protein
MLKAGGRYTPKITAILRIFIFLKYLFFEIKKTESIADSVLNDIV